MKIIMTGAQSKIGSRVADYLRPNFEVVPIGRRENEYFWQLGIKPEPCVIEGADALLHFAWSMSDRVNDFHLNVGGTLQLAQVAKDLGVKFIFISSVAADGDSSYGKSKREAEKYVMELGGVIIRVGLVPGSSAYVKRGKFSRFNLVPGLAGDISLTEMEMLCLEIKGILVAISEEQKISSQIRSIVTSKIAIEDFFKKEGAVNIKVSKHVIITLLKWWSIFSLSGRNHLDAYRSLTSTMESK